MVVVTYNRNIYNEKSIPIEEINNGVAVGRTHLLLICYSFYDVFFFTINGGRKLLLIEEVFRCSHANKICYQLKKKKNEI